MTVRSTNPKRKEVARGKIEEFIADWKEAEAEVVRLRHRAYKGMLKAFNAGLTYNEIAELAGVSPIRVSQILADQRAKGNGK